jgi:hypothetical protein
LVTAKRGVKSSPPNWSELPNSVPQHVDAMEQLDAGRDAVYVKNGRATGAQRRILPTEFQGGQLNDPNRC